MHPPDTALLLLLLAGHALCDYPLQGAFLARAKRRHTAIGARIWPHALAAHSLIHGGMVAALTGSFWLGVAETTIHAATDWAKCEGKIGFRTDQAVHVCCKLAWFALASWDAR